MLFWPVAASKAPYRPSGDGTTHQYSLALSPSSTTRRLPLGSTPNITGSPFAVWLATNTLLLSAAQSMPPRAPQGLKSTSRVVLSFTDKKVTLGSRADRINASCDPSGDRLQLTPPDTRNAANS